MLFPESTRRLLGLRRRDEGEAGGEGDASGEGDGEFAGRREDICATSIPSAFRYRDLARRWTHSPLVSFGLPVFVDVVVIPTGLALGR